MRYSGDALPLWAAAGGSSAAGGSGSAVAAELSAAFAAEASSAVAGCAAFWFAVGEFVAPCWDARVSALGGPAVITAAPFTAGALGVANVRASASDASTTATVESASERLLFHCDGGGGGLGLSSYTDGSTAMLGGGAIDRGRSVEYEPELDAETARCPPLGVAVSVAVRAGGGIETGRVVIGGVEPVAGGGGMLGAFGNGVDVVAVAGGADVIEDAVDAIEAGGALAVADAGVVEALAFAVVAVAADAPDAGGNEFVGAFSRSLCAVVLASSAAEGAPGEVGRPIAARSGSLGALETRLARSEPKSTGASDIAGGGIDAGFFGGVDVVAGATVAAVVAAVVVA